MPRDYLRLEVRKAGYQTIELAVPMFSVRIPPIREHLKMDPLGSVPENMVRIPKSTTDMQIVGIEKYGPREVPKFLIDKFEVTNKQFKVFVDAGGYANAAYWTVPIRDGGKAVPLNAALAKFTDRTGRQGIDGPFPDRRRRGHSRGRISSGVLRWPLACVSAGGSWPGAHVDSCA